MGIRSLPKQVSNLFVWFGFEKKRRVPSGGSSAARSAGDTGGRRPAEASRLRAKMRRRRGSPTPDTPAAGWEAQETPGARRNRPPPSPRPQLPPRAGHRARYVREPRAPQDPRGEVTSKRGHAARLGVCLSTASAPSRRLDTARSQGCEVLGEEPSRGPRIRGAGRRQRPWRVTCGG